MTAYGRATNPYLQTQVRSSTPLELVVMLYDGALRHATAARDAMERRDIPARKAAMSKAMAIVSELQSTLDLDKGGPVAEELDRLYTWITQQLIDATVRRDVAPIDEVRKVLTILRDAWQQIAVPQPMEMAR